jgi:hypothetical protein
MLPLFTNSLTVFYNISGTASNSLDFTNLNGSVTFAPDQTDTNIFIHPLADTTIFDEDKVVTLTLTNRDGRYNLDPITNATSATITIFDKPGTNIFKLVARLSTPTGIDYSALSNCLVVSFNFSSGVPRNFAQIFTNIVQTNTTVVTNVVVATTWSGIAGLQDEVKLAVVNAPAGAPTNSAGFTNGDIFFGSNTGIGWMSADGTRSNLNWCILTNSFVTNALLLRGGLCFDQSGVFSNMLIAVTSPGGGVTGQKGIWMVDAQRHPTLLTNIETLHLEGVVTVTNNAEQWGPFAGAIITGDEDDHKLYTVRTNGVTTTFFTTNFIGSGFDTEDLDLVPSTQSLYACDPDYPNGSGVAGAILKIDGSLLTNCVGNLMITQAGESLNAPTLFVVRWSSVLTNFITRKITYRRPGGAFGHLEHVTFAPIEIPGH